MAGNEKSSIEHLKAWSRIENVEVIASDKDRVIEFVRDIKSSQFPIIDLCMPVSNLADMIRELYRDGLHIFCELPSITTQEKARAIFKESKNKNVSFSVENTLRFSPEFADARNQVKNGNIGKPGVIRLSISGSHPGGEADIYSELGIPLFDWLLWSFGDVDRIMAKHIKKQDQNGAPIEYAVVTLRMADHTFAHVELTWAKKKSEISFELTGDKGMISYNSKDMNPIDIQLNNGEDINLDPDHTLAKSKLQRQLEFVAKLEETQNQDMFTAEHVVKVIQIKDAAKQSANTDQPVSLKEVCTK